MLYAILDEVVDEYLPVVAGLENDIDEIEDQVFAGDPEVSRRIYELFREVIEFQRATKPLLKIVTDLSGGFEKYHVDEELQRFLRDVQDHTIRIVERVDGFRALLQNILTVNATLVAQRQNEETQRLTETSLQQNEEVKKISSWAAILFAPTLVGTIYGMNFAHMPELDWRYGYPMAIGLMLLMGCVLYAGVQAPRLALSVVRATRDARTDEPGTSLSIRPARDRVTATARAWLGVRSRSPAGLVRDFVRRRGGPPAGRMRPPAVGPRTARHPSPGRGGPLCRRSCTSIAPPSSPTRSTMKRITRGPCPQRRHHAQSRRADANGRTTKIRLAEVPRDRDSSTALVSVEQSLAVAGLAVPHQVLESQGGPSGQDHPGDVEGQLDGAPVTSSRRRRRCRGRRCRRRGRW